MQPQMSEIISWPAQLLWRLWETMSLCLCTTSSWRHTMKNASFKGRGLFFDSLQTVSGCQSIQNRLPHIAQIKSPWNELGTPMTNDTIRILLKKTFFSYTATITLDNNWFIFVFSNVLLTIIKCMYWRLMRNIQVLQSGHREVSASRLL